MKFVAVRISARNLSTPRISASPATGIAGTTANVAARVMKLPPKTPAMPFDVSIATPSSDNCWPQDRSMFIACAMKQAAIAR